MLLKAASEYTVSQGPSDSEMADQDSTGDSHQTQNILHNAFLHSAQLDVQFPM